MLALSHMVSADAALQDLVILEPTPAERRAWWSILKLECTGQAFLILSLLLGVLKFLGQPFSKTEVLNLC